MNKRFLTFFTLLTVIVLMCGCGSSAQTSATAAYASDHSIETVPVLTVTGKGKMDVDPDMATVNIGVNTQAVSAAEASAANGKTVADVVRAICAQGVAKEDIQTQNLSVYEQYDYDPETGESRISGYHANCSMSVRVYNIDSVSKVLQAATDAGSNESYGITFGIRNPEVFDAELADRAAKDAQNQAEAYAKAFGFKVDKILSMSTGSEINDPVLYKNYDMLAPEATSEEAAMDTDRGISAGTLTLSTIITVKYSLS